MAGRRPGEVGVRCAGWGGVNDDLSALSPFSSAAMSPQSSNSKFSTKKPLPSISPKSSLTSPTQLADPWYEEIAGFLAERAVSLLICKYKFESNLGKKLGFLSFPVTEALVDLLLGFKKVKGSRLLLSSQTDWSSLVHRLEGVKPRKPALRHAMQPGSLQHHGAPAAAASASASSTTRPAELSGTLSRERATEPVFSSDTELLSPQESTSPDRQTATSLSEPKFSMSSAVGVSPLKSKERFQVENSEGSEGDQGAYDNEGGQKDEEEGAGALNPDEVGIISHYVNLNHMGPP